MTQELCSEQKYTAESVVPYGFEGDQWLCHCSSGPERKWEEKGKEIVLCDICKKNCGHVKSYGLEKIHAKGGDIWEKYIHCCI